MAENVTKHAHFNEQKPGKTNNGRGRMLTMKYGKHQMMLIKKRMNVETWIDDKFIELYNGATDVVDFDIDAVLDLNTESERRRYVLDLLRKTHCPASDTQVNSFLHELMQKLDTL